MTAGGTGGDDRGGMSQAMWFVQEVPGLGEKLPPGAPPYQEAFDLQALPGEYERLGNEMLENIAEGYKGLELADRIGELREGLENPVYLETLERTWPLALVLMYAEFDTVTAGKRGIGRQTTANPRFGGTFRRQLSNPETRTAMAPIAERLIIGGYLGAMFVIQLDPDEVPGIRQRDLDDLAPRWFYDIHNWQATTEENLGMILSVGLEGELAEWESCAEQHGLIAGVRKGKARQALSNLALYYLSAGVCLLSLHFPSSDHLI